MAETDTMGLGLAVVTVVAVVVALLLGPARGLLYRFQIRIRDGRAILVSGRTRHGFLSDVQLIAERNGLRHGWVRGAASGRQTRLTFSGPIPPEARQQMRNAWALLR